MATLRQYFDTDFSRVLSLHQTWETQGPCGNIPVIARLHLDFDANAKFASCFIPDCENLSIVCRALIAKIDDLLKIGSDVLVQAGVVGLETADSRELNFTGRLFLYTERDVDSEECMVLYQLAAAHRLALRIRGPRLVMVRSKNERPLAFISHDSRDKDAVARPIAIGLSKFACPVWFDEFSLKVGDSLRESIEKGLKECKKCILILSPRFFSNPGWTKIEFNSIFTREIIEKRNLVLPVWHEVAKEAVFDYCPSLLDRLGIDWKLGEEEVVRRLYQAIMSA